MGFLDIILGRRQPNKVELRLNDIEGYIADNISTKGTAINKKIEQAYTKLSEELNSIKSNLNQLAIADIRDKVPDKARVRVLGNRDAYVRALQHFISSIHIPDITDQEIALNFCNDLNSSVNKFSETTKKNFYITQQLLGIELDKVIQNLRIINTTINSLKEELEREDIIIIKNLKQRINDMKEKRSKAGEISSKITELEQNLEPFLKVKEEILKDYEKMKNSKDYEIYDKLTKEKASLERKMQSLERGIKDVFSQSSKVIKKYNKAKKITLLDSYLESPFQALLQDTNLDLLQFIREIEEQITKDEILLKANQKEKMLKALSTLNTGYLNSMLQQYSGLKSNFMAVKSRMFSSRLAEEEMLLTSRLDSVNSNIRLIESDIQRLKKIIGKYDIEEDSRIVSNLLTKLTNKEYSIILG